MVFLSLEPLQISPRRPLDIPSPPPAPPRGLAFLEGFGILGAAGAAGGVGGPLEAAVESNHAIRAQRDGRAGDIMQSDQN